MMMGSEPGVLFDGLQIVSRRRGFTVETCTAVVPAAAETPSFQGLSAGQRVRT